MTIRVELNPEMERQLTAEALARGIALELYAQRLLQEAIGGWPTSHLSRHRNLGAPHLAFEMWVHVLLASTL